ncbi:hypothetical protein [Tenacibaculum sp. Ill]|uniref:hypothetical protein n=1 Tax=Tenacibaculum sp. Ill TaxID=3445935 RepID=UPI003F7A31A6
MKKITTFLLLALIVSFTSCSSDDEIQEKELATVTEEFQEKVNQMDLPSALESSENTYAQEASYQFNAVKNLGQSFSAFLTVPSNASSSRPERSGKGTYVSGSKTYTWSSDGITVKYTITETSDRYTFSYYVESSDFTGKLISGYQLKDGSCAEFSMYNENSVVATFKFWVNGDSIKAEMISENQKIYLETNTSTKEGTIKVYESDSLTAKYIWNANGTGSYTNHETNETFTW